MLENYDSFVIRKNCLLNKNNFLFKGGFKMGVALIHVVLFLNLFEMEVGNPVSTLYIDLTISILKKKLFAVLSLHTF